jgi:hypothetical protein
MGSRGWARSRRYVAEGGLSAFGLLTGKADAEVGQSDGQLLTHIGLKPN